MARAIISRSAVDLLSLLYCLAVTDAHELIADLRLAVAAGRQVEASQLFRQLVACGPEAVNEATRIIYFTSDDPELVELAASWGRILAQAFGAEAEENDALPASDLDQIEAGPRPKRRRR